MTQRERFLAAGRESPPRVAPYSFAPTPQDIKTSPHENLHLSEPLKGGISGTIPITITAETPLLVGGGDVTDPDTNKETPMRIGADNFVLPGSSIKGMIRAVMEIACAARLSFIDDFVGYVRDFGDPDWKDITPNPRNHKQTGGWLFRTPEDGFVLVNADRTIPVQISDIAQELQCSISEWHEWDLHNRLTRVQNAGLSGVQPLPAFGINEAARLVVAGPTAETGRTGKTAKEKEYAFVYPEAPEQNVTPLAREHVNKFLASLHRDSNVNNEDPQSNYDALLSTGGLAEFEFSSNTQRPSLEEQFKAPERFGLPVFWANDKGANPQKPTTSPILSLTAWLRVAAKNSLHDVIARSVNDPDPTRLDMVQAILGWAPTDTNLPPPGQRKGQQRAWKSRVKFSFATSKNAKLEGSTRIWAAPQPRPSFWPFYLRAGSDTTKHPLSYWRDDTKIAGRKRYPAKGASSQLPRDTNAVAGNNPGLTAREAELHFLRPGAEFHGEIRVHNLSQIELGALLWALTFGDLSGGKGYRHMLGRGKPHGYGQIKLSLGAHSLKKLRSEEDADLDAALKAFRSYMSDDDFEQLEHIDTIKGAAHPETGQHLANALIFSRMNGKPGEGEDQKILNAYMAMKKSGNLMGLEKQTAGSTSHFGLPRYPGPEGE